MENGACKKYKQGRNISTVFAFALVVLSMMVSYRNTTNLCTERSNLKSVDTKNSTTDSSESRSYDHGKVNETNYRFVFFAGVEGVGHHMIQTVAYKSPLLAHLHASGIHPKFTRRIDDLLCDHGGLWRNPPDIQIAYSRVVNNLESLNRQADSKNATMIPLNTLFKHMMSYPYGTEIRHIHIPILSLLHRACKEAKVKCGVVYLYRDAYEIINSAHLKRHFFSRKEMQANLRLYIESLNTISIDMLSHPDTTLHCIGLFKEGQPWIESMMKMWGYQDRNVIARQYKKKPSKNKTYPEDMIPSGLQPLMDLFVEANERTMAICEDIVSRNSHTVFPGPLPGVAPSSFGNRLLL